MGAVLQQYMRLAVPEILPLIGGYKKPEVRPLLAGVPCHVSGLRLFTFKTKGTRCVTCGIEGEFFAIERPYRSHPTYHLNLYAIREDGVHVLMTHDHILARSLGGSDTPNNAQTMCEYCNSEKSKGESNLAYKSLLPGEIGRNHKRNLRKKKAKARKKASVLLEQNPKLETLNEQAETQET
jgi:hypothetical protein